MSAFLRLILWPAIVFSGVHALEGAARGQQPPAPAPTPQPADARPAPTKSLQFNFQRQPWGEVLQWLADEADLSLVLDAPPPGSFNYTDAKAYSTVEAIDLVNSVLASKGYSLLRRERMLMLINLQDEIPRSLVPRETLGNVDLRGKHEFVTVAFPLEGRSAEAALAEIQPLISQFGQASALPASGQLIVTDRAGLMRVIATVVESIPKPKASAVAPAAKAEPPIFRVYALSGADAAAAVEILKSVVDGKFVHDPGGDRINAYATPAQHGVVEQLMEQVRGAAGQQQFRLEIYPIEGLTAARQTQLVADLSIGAVDAQMRFDAANGQLVVWANQHQHLEIRRALLTLLAAGTGSRRQAAQVYQLQNAKADDLIPLLQAALPDARVIQGGAPDRLMAIAAFEEHQIIDELLASLDSLDQRDPLTIKEYRVERDPPAELAALLASAAPDAKIRIDAARGSVVATGTAADQRLVAAALASAEGNRQPKPELDLAIYALSPLQRERFGDVRTSIEQTSPGARLVWNENAGELFVWAIPDDQATIERLLQSLGDTPRRPTTQRLRAYPTSLSQLEAMAAMIGQVTPKAVITVDRPGRRLLVWADETDHQRIEPVLEAAPAASPAPADPMIYHAYPAAGVDLTLAARLLSEIFPDAEIESDATARSIIANATASDQGEIEAMLRQLRDGNEHEVAVYPLGNVDQAQAESLRPLFPSMRISVDPSTSQIVAWGGSEDHRQFRDALISLGGGQAAGAWHIQTFPLEKARASEVAAGLEQLIPGVSTAAVNDAQLLVRSHPDLEPRVAELISQLDVSQTLRNRQNAQVFAIRFADPLTLQTTLRALFPEADGTHFSYDAKIRSMVAVADPDQMASIEEVILAADRRGGTDEGERLLRVHALAGVEGNIALETLQELFEERGARPLLSIDRQRNRLVAVATPAEQKLVTEILTSLAPPQTELQVFPLETMDPLTAELAIGQLFGGSASSEGSPVDIESDEDGGRILVRATPTQLAEIRSLLRKMGELHLIAPTTAAQATRFIPWNVADQAETLEQLQATWQQLRSNELRITTTETLRDVSQESVSQEPDPGKTGPESNPTEQLPPKEAVPENTPSAAQDQTPTNLSPEQQPVDTVRPSGRPATETASSLSPPVFLIPSPEGVAIASEDAAALDQLAVLLRAYGRGAAAANGDFGVFPLKNASAVRVAKVLTNIYRRSRRQIYFAADERINAVIAQGARGERREVEALLRRLDTAQTTDFFQPNQPVMLMLKHASAKQVHQQLQTLYKTELDRGKRQPPIEIPPGADPELVATLEQINASREGPLLSLEVDVDSNSLMLIAPRPLLEEIRKFVAQVDQQSTQSRVGVRVIPLEALKGDEILRSLEQILIERR